MQSKVRYKALIEYDGSKYLGWQKQNTGVSVESAFLYAASCLFKYYPEIYVSGRTDAGVHALNQVIHIDLDNEYNISDTIRSLNHFLKGSDIVIKDMQKVDSSFHARFSAIERAYLYRIYNFNTPSVLYQNFTWWVRDEICINSMQKAANVLLGTHDFTSFRATACQAKSPIKTMKSISISKSIEMQNVINLYFRAPSFLHHMVRNIVGTLKLIGTKKILSEDMIYILNAKNRTAAGPTAPAKGLCLIDIKYDL